MEKRVENLSKEESQRRLLTVREELTSKSSTETRRNGVMEPTPREDAVEIIDEMLNHLRHVELIQTQGAVPSQQIHQRVEHQCTQAQIATTLQQTEVLQQQVDTAAGGSSATGVSTDSANPSALRLEAPITPLMRLDRGREEI